ncbi:MAG: hypothetical protein LC790_05030 [Actinobacteria bacterium]|nr:hypothetical protein [Actinomycetota bacterium]
MSLARVLSASSAAAGVAVATKGLDFSTDGKEHRFVTYLGFYSVGVALVLVAFMLWVFFVRNREPGATGGLGTDPITATSTFRLVRQELDTIEKTVRRALDSGRWWRMPSELLPADKWNGAPGSWRDGLPAAVSDLVSGAYTEADIRNKDAIGAPSATLTKRDRINLTHLSTLVIAAREALRKVDEA